jgi:DNA processing protein
VPGSPLDPRARGCNELIRQGAVLCEGVDDVMRALSGLRTLAEPPGRYDDLDRNALDRDDAELRERVAALLSPTPVPRDELARITGAPAGAVMGALMELSLAGRAELLPGGTVASA